MKAEVSHAGRWGRSNRLERWWDDIHAFFTVWGHSWKQTVVQIKKQPCVYCLGLFSCLTTVMITAAVQSALEKTPVIFLQEGEREQGQVDLRLNPEDSQQSPGLNHTLMSYLLETTPFAAELSYHSPRSYYDGTAFNAEWCYASVQVAAETAGTTPPAANDSHVWLYAAPPVPVDEFYGGAGHNRTACRWTCAWEYCSSKLRTDATLVAYDHEREERMGLGRDWALPPLRKGEAYIAAALALALSVDEGEDVVFSFPAADLVYNMYYPTPELNVSQAEWRERVLRFPTVSLSLRIAALVSNAEGKLPNDDESFIFVDFASLPELVGASLHPALLSEDALGAGTERAALQVLDDSGDGGVTPDQAGRKAVAAPVVALRPRQAVTPAASAEAAAASGSAPAPAATVTATPAAELATEVVLNLPPDERLDLYLDSNYDNLQDRLLGIASDFAYVVGFSESDLDTPILWTVRARRFVSLFMGLIMTIVILMLATQSAILVYSLLMINVQARTFELAVRRMLGTSLSKLFNLLFTQALSYSLPAWAFGLALAQLFTLLIISAMLGGTGIDFDKKLTPTSIWIGTTLGLCLPLIAAIGPISSALGTSLREALDFARAKTKAVKFSIERAADGRVSWAVLAIGSVSTVFGFSVYYLLPLSLLSFNLALFFNIFFAILVGLLCGCVILALNLETTVERCIATLFLFWEHRALRNLALKNLIAHRIRNRKTTLMFALSIAFIIFILVAAQTQIALQSIRLEQLRGAPVIVRSTASAHPIRPAAARRIAEALDAEDVAPLVESYTPVAQPLSWMLQNEGVAGSTRLSNVGRVYGAVVRLYGATPSFLDTCYEEYLKVESGEDGTAVREDELLYTARGSQRMWISDSYRDFFGASVGDPMLLAVGASIDPDDENTAGAEGSAGDEGGEETTGDDATQIDSASERRFLMSPAVTLSSAPRLRFSKFQSSGTNDAVVSFPTYATLSEGKVQSVRDAPLRYFLIRPKDGISDEETDLLMTRVQNAIAGEPDVQLSNLEAQTADLGSTVDLIDTFFSFLTGVAMFLCFFSLLASMMANVAEQSKEIGVLRAIGLQPFMLLRVYVYEAFVLVMSAAFMGLATGTLIGWTFTAQQTLFTQLPVPFQMPVTTISAIIVLSIVFAIVSALTPAQRLMRANITSVLRGAT